MYTEGSLLFLLGPSHLPLLSTLLLSAESLVYQCYEQQMERMQYHFPPNQGVSEKLANLRALVEVR